MAPGQRTIYYSNGRETASSLCSEKKQFISSNVNFDVTANSAEHEPEYTTIYVQYLLRKWLPEAKYIIAIIFE